MLDVHFRYPRKLQNACEYFNLPTEKEGFESRCMLYALKIYIKFIMIWIRTEQKFIETIIIQR